MRRRGGQPDLVERYLRRLAFWCPRRSRRDLVAEARRHLYDATRRGMGLGMTGEAAQRAAIGAFGPAWRLGLAARGWPGRFLLDPLFRPRLWRAGRHPFALPARALLRRRAPSGRPWERTCHTLRRLARRSLR